MKISRTAEYVRANCANVVKETRNIASMYDKQGAYMGTVSVNHSMEGGKTSFISLFADGLKRIMTKAVTTFGVDRKYIIGETLAEDKVISSRMITEIVEKDYVNNTYTKEIKERVLATPLRVAEQIDDHLSIYQADGEIKYTEPKVISSESGVL